MENMTMEQMSAILDRARLNWTVRKENIQTESGIIIPDNIAVIREDTEKCLGIHSKNYPIYQNEQMLEFMFRVSNRTGLEFHSGGFFGGGEKVWIQLKSTNLLLQNDRVEGKITTISSFDGSTSLAAGNTTTTISCMNTFWKAYHDQNMKARFRHSANMIERIDEFLLQIDSLVEEEQTMFEKIKRMTTFEMDAKTREMVLNKLFDLKKEEKLDDLSTVKKNKIERFNFDLDHELSEKGQTLWGLFNGVTRYTTHSMKKNKDNTESKIFGTTGQKELEVWNMLTEKVS